MSTVAKARTPRRTVATYEYQDADGHVVYRVRRFEPKGFMPEVPNDAGGWTAGLNGAPRVLYRLPEFLAASKRTGFVVEGEKDADRLHELGLIATTNAGGSASWHKHAGEYAEAFRGRPRVVVLIDNDEPGRHWGDEVASSVASMGCKVAILELPDLPVGGDVSDWLGAGHSVDELKKLATAAPPWTPCEVPETDTCALTAPADGVALRQASAERPERVSWAWDQSVPIGMASLLVGEGGLGKSLLVIRLAADWSRGKVPGDLRGVPVNVAIASAEDHRQAVLIPRLLAAGADMDRVFFIEHSIDGTAGDIAIDGEVEAIETALVDANVRVLLIDTVVAHIPIRHDANGEQSVRAVLKPLSKMAERNDLVVFGTMHLNRRDARDVLTRISGSGAFGNLARSVLLLAHDPDEPDGPSRILAIGKSNVGGRTPAKKLSLEACSIPDDTGGQIPTVRLVDAGESAYTSSDLLGPREDGDKLTAISEAEDFLRDYLTAGPVESKAVKNAAKDAGIATHTLWRAVKRLGVKTNDRAGFGPGFPSRWRLRVNASEDGSVGTVGKNGSVGNDAPSVPTEPVPLPTQPLNTHPPRVRARDDDNAPPLTADWVEKDDKQRAETIAAGLRWRDEHPRSHQRGNA